MNIAATLQTDITPEGDDYTTVRRVIEMITEDYRAQPGLEDIASRLGQSPTQLQKTFTRWAGLSPKAFLQAVTLDHAKRLVRQEEQPLLETSFEVGLSGQHRDHLAVGAGSSLWDGFLLKWIAWLRTDIPDIAVSAIAASPSDITGNSSGQPPASNAGKTVAATK